MYIKLTDSITMDEYYFTVDEGLKHLAKQLNRLDENTETDLHYIVTPLFISEQEFLIKQKENQ